MGRKTSDNSTVNHEREENSPSRSITMKDIATHAGVSRATVGFVLSGKESPVRISEETKRRVQDAATALRYRPNGVARAMRSGRFGSVALVLSTVRTRSLIPIPLLDGIHDALAKNDMLLVLTRMPDEKLTSEGFVPKILRESSSDGLIINYNANIPHAMLELIRTHHIPAVWVNSKQPSSCVYPDDFRGMQEAVRILHDRGHRRIAYVDFSTSAHYSSEDRANGYSLQMHEFGLEVQLIRPQHSHDWKLPVKVAHLLPHLTAPDRPTAILTYTPQNIAPVMLAAHEAGLHVPQDVSVITVAEFLQPHFGMVFDTMVLPEYAMGERAVEMLLQLIENPDTLPAPEALPLTYGQGETVRTL
jgi:LacI family transcriptional regulator